MFENFWFEGYKTIMRHILIKAKGGCNINLWDQLLIAIHHVGWETVTQHEDIFIY